MGVRFPLTAHMFSNKKVLLILAGLTLLIYGQSLFGSFVFDDRGILEHQELLSSTNNLIQVSLYSYWPEDAGLYRPTSLLSYLFNIVFLGLGAWGFHLVNILLYIGIAWLIYLWLKDLWGNEHLAIFASALFTVLPIHTEVVANITGRLELLALLFSLLALREVSREGRGYWLAGIYTFFAVGAKEVAIAVLPLMALTTLVKKRSLLNWPLISGTLGVLVYFTLRFVVLGPAHFLGVETSLIENPLLFESALSRVATALSILTMYLGKTFWPANLCSDYSYNQIAILDTLLHFKVLIGFGVLALSGLGIVLYRRSPILAMGSAVFFFSFLPVSNIFFPIGTIAGERLFFYPTLGLMILVAYGLSRVKWGGQVLVAVCLIYSIIAFNRQAVWLTEESLFINASQCSPQSVLSLSNLGTVYYFKGDYAEAERVLLQSKAIKPIYSKGLNNLGLVYWKWGRLKETEELYHEALLQKYPYNGALENLVLLNLKQGDTQGALRWLRILYPNVGDSVLRSQF